MTRTGIARMITRETGLALALLALWMMSLLVPLHQTSGLLRDMARAGHDISGAWSICVTLGQDGEGQDHVVPVCPAQGIGKHALMAPPPPVLVASAVVVTPQPWGAADEAVAHRPQNFTPGRPRAPPAQV